MPQRSKTVYIMIFILFGVIFLGWHILTKNSDVNKKHYVSYNLLAKDAAYKSYFPEVLPANAYDLYIENNVDTNLVYGEYSVPKEFINYHTAIFNSVDITKEHLLQNDHHAYLKIYCILKKGDDIDAFEGYIAQLEGQSNRLVFWSPINYKIFKSTCH